MSDRVSCCVPHCKRSTARSRLKLPWIAPQYVEWICDRHWRALPRARRAAYLRSKRRMFTPKTLIWRGPAIARLWRRLKQMAIERAGGL